MRLPAELTEFLETGPYGIVGTVSTAGIPECTRASGVRVSGDGELLRVFLPEATSGVALANLRQNPRLAVTLSRIPSHQTYQLKGECVGVHEADAADDAVLTTSVARLWSDLRDTGWPAHILGRMAVKPVVVVQMRIDELYEQTPGPAAGRPVGAA